jgi:nucleoside-diphosphate-sugar epimerase
MHVFMTGATGYLGRAIVTAGLRAGWKVSALVRSPEAADELADLGVTSMLGALDTPARYTEAARAADVIVHAAADHSAGRVALDRAAIDAFLTVGHDVPGKTFIYTSGVWVLGSCRAGADETAAVDPLPIVQFRPAHEQLVLDGGREGFRTVVVRPGVVFGSGRGMIGDMFRDAANGLMRIVGAGDNVWPLVYDRDMADLYVRLAASPEARGIFHATDDSEETVLDMANAMVEQLGRPVEIRHVPIEEARTKLGAYADALALDQRVHSTRSRALGWAPTLSGVAANVPRLLEEWRNAARH